MLKTFVQHIQHKLKSLKKYLKEYFTKGFIRASFFFAMSFVFFAYKPGVYLQFCINYWQLNDMSIKNRYLFLLIKKTLERICKAKIYSKIDIITLFSYLQLQQKEEQKTAFHTYYGFYKYLVMLFNLSNASLLFQNFIKNVLHEILNNFYIAYIHDILIYSNSKKEY